MDCIQGIRSTIEYMENHLTDDITLSDIAESVYISAFHFQRAFSMMTGITPTEYLRNRRLSEAGAELANGNERVIVGFHMKMIKKEFIHFKRKECMLSTCFEILVGIKKTVDNILYRQYSV